MFSSYIDRQKSRVGSSEKSQKVHSANWKEEVQLRKELHCLNKQEHQRVSRISIEQRLVVNRFQKKLSRSVEISKSHEHVMDAVKDNKTNILDQVRKRETTSNEHMRTVRCLNAFPKPPIPKFRKQMSKSCEPPKLKENQQTTLAEEESKNTEKIDLVPRPMTALEKRNKLWERQLSSVTQRINRARSAPTRTVFYKVPEFTVDNSKITKRINKTGAKRSAMNYTVDMDMYRYMREREITKQNEAVKNYLNSIEGLELVPWTPFDYEQDESNSNREIRRISRQRTSQTGAAPVNAWT